MTVINFSDEMAPLVAARSKRQTIRRKRNLRAGQTLQLYTRLRTQQALKLVPEDPVCTLATYCCLRRDYVTLGPPGFPKEDIDAFARRDGFRDYATMWDWFCQRYPKETGVGSFSGICIRWDWPDPTPAREAVA